MLAQWFSPGLRKVVGKAELYNDTKLRDVIRENYNKSLKVAVTLWKNVESNINKGKITEALKEDFMSYLECDKCGRCCRGNNTVPIVSIFDLAGYLDKPDVKTKILRELTIFCYHDRSITGEELRGYFPTIRKRETSDCVFYSKNRGCTIYENRPIDCRVYPGIFILRKEIEENKILCSEALIQWSTPEQLLKMMENEQVSEWLMKRFKLQANWMVSIKIMLEMVGADPAFFWRILACIAADHKLHDLRYRLNALIDI
jgi:Fe-S-cluster containining protein